MNALRQFISRLALGGCFCAALAASPALAQWKAPQRVAPQRLEFESLQPVASKPKTTAKPITRYNVWEEDDAQEAEEKAAKASSQPAKEIEPASKEVQPPPKDAPSSRVVKNVRASYESEDPRMIRQPQRTGQRMPGYSPVAKRARPVGFVPRHQQVRGAQYLSDEPMNELLPPPPDAPSGMGVQGPNGEGAPEPAPNGNPPGGRSIISGRNGRPAGPGNSYYPGPNGMGMPMGEEVVEGMPFGGNPFDDMGGGNCATCGGGGCGGGGCLGGGCPGGDCGPYWAPFGGRFRECFPCLALNLQNLDIFSGVQGFTNSTNRGGAGSFGYHFGFNKGRPVYCLPCTNLSWQIGMAGVFSNFDGATFNNGGALATTAANRNQLFVTWGLFRRVDWGLQFGMAFDYLHDDWYANMDVGQVRGEMSWVYPNCHELGFWFASGVHTGRDNAARVFAGGVQVNPPPVETWSAIDLYAAFYRYRFAERGGEARTFGGFTGDGDGLVGGDIWLPINNNWSFQANYTYLIPNNNGGAFANTNEAWNLAMSMVWSPGACRNNSGVDYNRPLFNVANNGNFILRRR